jgi:outer membrane protein
MKTKNYGYLFILLCLMLFSRAQNVLTLSDAIKKAVEKNNQVVISKNQQEISKNQNSLGNAGMSPSVGINANYNFASVNSYQEFSNGTNQERNGAINKNLGASLYLNWTIFDGLKMFAVKKRLEQNEQLSAIALKQQIESTVYNIIVAYYNIVKVNELMKAARQNLVMSEERKKIAALKFDIGSDSKVDLLMSQSNANKAQSDLLQLELQVVNLKSQLNVLLTNRSDENFTTVDSIITTYEPSLDDLKKETVKNNPSVLFSKQNELIVEQSIKEAKSAFMPQVQLNGAYNFTRNQSEAGFLFFNRQAGLNAGISASWLIFNGNKNNRLVKERSLLALNQRLQSEQISQQVDAQVYVNYQLFLLNKKIAQLELQNLNDSKELYTISLERYKVGKTNLLETIESQKNLVDANVRYINALYAIKISETELLKANGSLVK